MKDIQKTDSLKYKSQQGVVLVISLLFMIIMTIVGVSSMSTNILEEKMVSNVRQQRIIFQAADSCNSQLLKKGKHTFKAGDWEDVWTDDSDESKRIGIGGMAYYSARYKQQMNTAPPRNSGYSHNKFRASHNVYECIGEDKETGSSTVTVSLKQGIYQIAPNPK